MSVDRLVHELQVDALQLAYRRGRRSQQYPRLPHPTDAQAALGLNFVLPAIKFRVIKLKIRHEQTPFLDSSGRHGRGFVEPRRRDVTLGALEPGLAFLATNYSFEGIRPELTGPWADGHVLERQHTISSEFIGYHSNGHAQFDNNNQPGPVGDP